MRVLWLCPYPYPGVNQHPAYWISEWAKHLSNYTDLDIHLVSFSPFCKGSSEDINQDGLKLTYIKSPRGTIDLFLLYRLRISRLRNYFEQNQRKYDLVHIHGIENQLQAACVNSSIPVIISIQGIITESFPLLDGNLKLRMNWYLAKRYEAKYMNITKNYFCRTEWDKKFIRKKVHDARIFHNWEMIRDDFQNVSPDIKSKRILFTGGTHPGKGLDLALKILRKVNEDGSNFKLIIAGNYYDDLLDNILKQNGFSTKDSEIEVKGFLNTEEMIEEFNKSLCLLHPTLIDNSANTICEAQLAGLPVIASEVGGVSSLIINNQNGLLADLSISGLVQRVRELSGDKILWKKISEKSRGDAKLRHDRDEITKVTLKTYKSIIEDFNR